MASAWGPDGRWRAWFGDGVLDGVVDLIRAHREGRLSGLSGWEPALIGCVPWLTDSNLVEELAMLPGGCCLVIGKAGRDPAPSLHLQTTGIPIPKGCFIELDELAPGG